MNTFVFVWIYGGLRACLFLSLFTCPSIFILLSRHNIALLWKPDRFMFPEYIKTSRLITHNSELKVPELKM